MIFFGGAAGAVAGAGASAAMELFQTAWTKARSALAGPPRKEAPRTGTRAGARESDPATVKVADAAKRAVAGEPIRPREKAPAGRLVHYGFGIANGVLYGALAELAPIVTLGFGAAFGIAVWIYADNLVLWALRLSKAPSSYPLSTHAYAFASHIVYGLALEGVRSVVRPMLPA